mmetsp:Transcript_9231/g.13478  ORF Transcript_9231/g.13478 Transcript_9231/m.13478 type:complete len:90 (-) Transcript_9231:536-805(-)
MKSRSDRPSVRSTGSPSQQLLIESYTSSNIILSFFHDVGDACKRYKYVSQKKVRFEKATTPLDRMNAYSIVSTGRRVGRKYRILRHSSL